ncbi:MAG: DegT/DnrJ/EryC1/StrS family aminotransferase [Cyanobacteria bacterium J06626_18]
MIPRKRLDIGWTDLLAGAQFCLWSERSEHIEQRLKQVWCDTTSASLMSLSVRSGFDALLQTLNFEPGSEILVSAVTIRGMTRIIEAHGLVPVPIDVDFTRLSVRPEAMAKAVTEHSKAILIAHLFGSRMAMEPILQFAQAHQLLVIEDCAQAYAGDGYWGHSLSDVSLFSFGPIKTATALAGGVLLFRNAALCEAVRAHQDTWPVQSQWRFLARTTKYALLMLLSYRIPYSLFVALCSLLQINRDRLISNSVRGFSGDAFWQKIRQRPSAALLALLERRLQQFDPVTITERIQLVEQVIQLQPSWELPGQQAFRHTHWVFPILCDAPEHLMAYLWRQGFDATRGGSSLYVVDAPVNRPETDPVEAKRAFQHLLYLPVYAGLSSQDLNRLVEAIHEWNAPEKQASVLNSSV